jgi:hypothetical protein
MGASKLDAVGDPACTPRCLLLLPIHPYLCWPVTRAGVPYATWLPGLTPAIEARP